MRRKSIRREIAAIGKRRKELSRKKAEIEARIASVKTSVQEVKLLHRPDLWSDETRYWAKRFNESYLKAANLADQLMVALGRKKPRRNLGRVLLSDIARIVRESK